MFLLPFILFSSFLILNFIVLKWILISLFIILGICGILTILPFKASQSIRIPGPQDKVDERDALFHRFYRLKPGTPEFMNYYANHPEKIKNDELIRNLPSLGEAGSRSYHELNSPYQSAIFMVLESITRELEWRPQLSKNDAVTATPDEFTRRIKGFAEYLGAKMVGITKLNPAYIYSHIGRSPGKWGEKIDLSHPYAIAIAVEMSHEMINQAPEPATTTETASQYFEAAKVAMIIAKYINLLGYEARAHVDGNYRVMCVPIAADAGIGELGRLGLLITPKYGPRVRIAVVTTNLPLIPDKPISFGVQHFCSICKKCAEHCPSASVDSGEKAVYAGVEKWRSEQDSCYRFWRTYGTDCGICIKVCPYSYPDTLFHNLIRWFVRRNNFARQIALWGDDLFYGKGKKINIPPPDWHH